jgi:hypothetical protein
VEKGYQSGDMSTEQKPDLAGITAAVSAGKLGPSRGGRSYESKFQKGPLCNVAKRFFENG